MTAPSTGQGADGLLRAARRERGWSQSRAVDELIAVAAARAVPVAAAASLKTQLSRWENGHALPEGHYRELLAELYQRPADQLGLSPAVPAGGGPGAQRHLLADRLAGAEAIDDGALALLREQLDTARRLVARLGAAATAGAVRGQLTDLELALLHCLLPARRRRIATDWACAVSPSACASATTALPMLFSPARVSRCTVICLTKSAADNPPRTRAAPAVGSTWFEPMA